MLVQDPSCWVGAVGVPDHLYLEGTFDLMIAVVSVYSFVCLEGHDVQDAKMRLITIKHGGRMEGNLSLFCFSDFLEVDIFGTENLGDWRKC